MTMSFYVGTIYNKVKSTPLSGIRLSSCVQSCLVDKILSNKVTILRESSRVIRNTQQTCAPVYSTQIAKQVKICQFNERQNGGGMECDKDICHRVLLVSCGLMGLTGAV